MLEKQKMLNPCPSCGNDAILDWGNVTEFSFGCYQTASVDCTNPDCYVSVNIEIDTTQMTDTNAEDVVTQAWNSLCYNNTP